VLSLGCATLRLKLLATLSFLRRVKSLNWFLLAKLLGAKVSLLLTLRTPNLPLLENVVSILTFTASVSNMKVNGLIAMAASLMLKRRLLVN